MGVSNGRLSRFQGGANTEAIVRVVDRHKSRTRATNPEPGQGRAHTVSGLDPPLRTRSSDC
jgi:hypothetical protein